MSEELPDHLKPVREILMDSAISPAEDEAPGAPSDLLDDLEESLLGTTTPPVTTARASFFEKIRSLFASPAFGAVSALIVVLFIALPFLNREEPGGFRSGNEDYTEGPQILLVGIEDEAFEKLAASGLFDTQALIRTDDPDAIEAPKLVLYFTTQTLVAIGAGGTEMLRKPMPEDRSALPSAIAQALSEFPRE